LNELPRQRRGVTQHRRSHVTSRIVCRVQLTSPSRARSGSRGGGGKRFVGPSGPFRLPQGDRHKRRGCRSRPDCKPPIRGGLTRGLSCVVRVGVLDAAGVIAGTPTLCCCDKNSVLRTSVPTGAHIIRTLRSEPSWVG